MSGHRVHNVSFIDAVSIVWFLRVFRNTCHCVHGVRWLSFGQWKPGCRQTGWFPDICHCREPEFVHMVEFMMKVWWDQEVVVGTCNNSNKMWVQHHC